MVYLENPPGYDLLENELAWEKTFATEQTERRNRNSIAYSLGRAPKHIVNRLFRRNKLMRYIDRFVAPGPVLDVGCAGGHTFASLPDQYIPFGIEISSELSQRAQQQFAPRGGSVIQADAISGLQRLEAHQFTGIVMTSYLEHESHARPALLEARRVLQTGGRVILKVPNYSSWNRRMRGADWCGYRFPDHVNYFTPATLQKILKENGYTVVRFNLGDRLPTSDSMWLVAEAVGTS